MLTQSRQTIHGLTILTLLFAGSMIFGSVGSADQPPNIVMIISDDQAYGDYSFMGHRAIETPNLDKLAAESLTFRRGYVPDSLCRPSLLSMISGLYPHQHGVVGNDPPRQANTDYLAIRATYIDKIDAVETLPKMLAPLGYASHQSGKWWEGNYRRGGFTAGMTHGDMKRGGRHGDDGLRIGRQGLEPIRDFLDKTKQASQPFFLWYAPFLPHTPHNPPQRLLDKYLLKTDSPAIAKYWAMCEWFDETCGELIDEIDQRGLRENTIFVYVTDNGWINDAKESRYAPRSKRSPNEGGIRTPIMINWRGTIEPKMNDRDLASSLDLVPTLLAAINADPRPELPGIDLLDADAVAKRQTVFGEIFEHDIVDMEDPWASLRYLWVIDGNWKLIAPNPSVVGDEKVELYDLANDPDEVHNLAAQNQDVVERLRNKLKNWRSRT